jgi:ribosomal protein S18 acetylase RimI-like enzyme
VSDAHNFIKEEIFEKLDFSDCVLTQPVTESEWREYYRIHYIPTGGIIDSACDSNHEIFTNESHFHFILKKGIEIIGIVHIEFFQDETRAAIISMAIDFSYQNQGYGTHLLRLTEEWIRNQGRTSIQVHSNSQAVKFYEKFDYFVKYRLVIENESVLIKWLKDE